MRNKDTLESPEAMRPVRAPADRKRARSRLKRPAALPARPPTHASFPLSRHCVSVSLSSLTWPSCSAYQSFCSHIALLCTRTWPHGFSFLCRVTSQLQLLLPAGSFCFPKQTPKHEGPINLANLFIPAPLGQVFPHMQSSVLGT